MEYWVSSTGCVCRDLWKNPFPTSSILVVKMGNVSISNSVADASLSGCYHDNAGLKSP